MIDRPNPETIALLRRQNGHTFDTLATRARACLAERDDGGPVVCSTETVRQMERGGRTRYSPRIMWAVATALEVTVSDLCGKTLVIERPLPLQAAS
jgi:transcriptional regulator with XRE-family HTH domain